MATDLALRLTPAEYLAFERAAETKHEFHGGEVREMTGASRPHNLIACRIAALLETSLTDRPFEVYQSDMRVRIPRGPYYYPDVVVAPAPPLLEDDEADTLLNPLVLVEVLSPSTEHIDRGEKLDAYRRIPSLAAYVIVSQDRLRADCYRREQDRWPLEIVTDSAARLPLPLDGCDLTLSNIYRRVFPTAG